MSVRLKMSNGVVELAIQDGGNQRAGNGKRLDLLIFIQT